MNSKWMKSVSVLALSSVWTYSALGGQAPPPVQNAPPPTAKAGARADLTGYWVAVVDEDWRFRMITAPVGDFESIPLTAAGEALAKKWDLAADNAKGDQCKAFGAGGILRQPTRLHITWQDDNTLKLETDAGQQTRIFRFGAKPAAGGERTWQGNSVAEWLPPRAPPIPGPGGPPPEDANAPGSLQVVTNNLRAGYLRKNGIPYSENAVVTDYFDRVSFFGNDFLMAVTVVEDPVYLGGRFVVSSQFKREADGSKWDPKACATDPPTTVLQPTVQF